MHRVREAAGSRDFRPAMARRLPILALAFAVAVTLWPAASRADQLCSRSFAQPTELLSEIRRNPLIEKLGERGAVAGFVDQNALAVWVFTLPGHAAHPAVICSRLVEQGDQVRVRTEASCRGAAADCNRLVAEVKAMNEKLQQRLLLRRAAWRQEPRL